MTLKNLFIFLLVSLVSVCSLASPYPDDYDKEFKRVKIYLPLGTDWRLLKAQCWQESRLRFDAVSPVGAVGLCQFMPNTWKYMQERHGGFTDPYLPIQSIRAAAIYMGYLNDKWISPRPYADRYKLALASYNAGFGNILKAQEECDWQVLYDDIIQCLPKVTGHHSKETIDYVDLIWYRWYPSMRF